MAEKYSVGQVVEGKVTGVQTYGAFVALDEEVQGLVHISEITDGFVKDINDFVTSGDQVKVKIIEMDEISGKYSLSMKALNENAQSKKTEKKQVLQDEKDGFNTLKEKLGDWIKQSEQSGNQKK
ncbi:S1 domain-containing post-transcriptional regulator GSP13 [Saliterribacillus persicus]|uniref:General stress protein 13 n=1 Tax=Saliterribacillus persicus TaxID=930114 RepID=A0A368XH55_9BACI|nr:S1 domain-containing post-transcriptional regulator GSP13 [Saliterribacillus persicus]RCW66929.1 general stress protein 13 [Saliterribacillus persicus]